jgi:hypothetical protein
MAKKLLFSLNALSSELNRNFRTLAKAMANVKPDGKAADRRPRWFVSTAVAALAEHEKRTGRVQTRPGPQFFDPVTEACVAAIEASGRDVDQFLAKLRSEPTVEGRRELVEGGAAKCIGKHERALRQTVGESVHAPLREAFIDQMMDKIMGEVLGLCEWRVVPQ